MESLTSAKCLSCFDHNNRDNWFPNEAGSCMARRQPTTAFGQFAETIALVSQGRPGHIVDTLIAERGQRIVGHPLWPVMRPFLYTLLRYNKAMTFANDIANMPGFQCFEYMSNLLNLDIGVT